MRSFHKMYNCILGSISFWQQTSFHLLLSSNSNLKTSKQYNLLSWIVSFVLFQVWSKSVFDLLHMIQGSSMMSPRDVSLYSFPSLPCLLTIALHVSPEVKPACSGVRGSGHSPVSSCVHYTEEAAYRLGALPDLRSEVSLHPAVLAANS